MQTKTQQLIDKGTEALGYASGGTTAIGSVTGFLQYLNEYAPAFGVIITLGMFIVNFAYKEYYRRKSLKDDEK